LSILFKQVLPLLRQIGQVAISDEVYQYISDEELLVTFYLKKRQGMIDLRVDYAYGEVIFSTDEKHQVIPEGHPEVLRDYKQEQRVALLAKTLDFSETATGWQKVLPEGEALYRFFTRELSYLRQLGEVRLGKKLKEHY